MYFCFKTEVALLYSYVQKAVIRETEVALKTVYTKGLKYLHSEGQGCV